MIRHSDVVYICGKRFILDGDALRPVRAIGRPDYATRYGEPTQLLRVPVSLLPGLLRQMEQMEVAEKALRAAVGSDVLYTSPGFTIDDLDRVQYDDN